MKYLIPLLFLFGCASPVVGYSNFSGIGDVRTDGQYLLAFGDIAGEAGLFAKGSNFPLTIPFVVDHGLVFCYDALNDIEEYRLVSDPLPAWARSLIPLGHQKQIETLLGVQLSFESE